MKKIHFTILVIILLVGLAGADTIKLKNGDVINGQLLRITSEFLIVEVRSTDVIEIKNISIKREDVENVIDENGKTLFENNRRRAHLASYYTGQQHNVLNSDNQFSLRFNDLPDTIYLKDGKKSIANIVGVDKDRLVLQKVTNLERERSVKYYMSLDRVDRINGQKIKSNDFVETKEAVKKISHYPHLVFELGGTEMLTHFNDVQQLFQNYYDYGELSFTANGVKSAYAGIKLSLLIQPSRRIALGISGYTGFDRKDRNIKIYIMKIV